MKPEVRTVHPTSVHERAVPVDDAERVRLAAAVGTPQGVNWEPLRIDWVRLGGPGGTRKLRRADAPFLDPGVLLVRDEVLPRVAEGLGPFGEFLAVDDVHGGERLWCFNAVECAEPFDASHSTLRGRDGGRVSEPGYYEFHRKRLRGLGAFVLPATGELCFTGTVLDAVWAANLRGLSLVEVWNGDTFGLPRAPEPSLEEVDAAIERLCRLHLGEFGPADGPRFEQLRADSRDLWEEVVEAATSPLLTMLAIAGVWELAAGAVLQPILARRRSGEPITAGEAFFADALILTSEQLGFDL